MRLHNQIDLAGKALWARDPKLARFAENRRILKQWDRKPQSITPLRYKSCEGPSRAFAPWLSGTLRRLLAGIIVAHRKILFVVRQTLVTSED